MRLLELVAVDEGWLGVVGGVGGGWRGLVAVGGVGGV